MGNPTCDLDSAVCALVYSFHYYTHVKSDMQSIATLPLFNIPEKEFRLKTEVAYYFEKYDISSEMLTFRDQLNLSSLSDEKKLELILVDHHTLPSNDESLANSVVEVIDHRPQDPSWLWSGKTTNLEIVGSCATLIARNLLEKQSEILDPVVCSLLRGPILIDTANFSKAANRATPADLAVIQELEEIGGIALDREQDYQAILSAKTDISRLSASDLLIRDLKVVNGIPLPGLPILVQDFINMDGAFEALTGFTQEYRCSVTVVLGLQLSNNTIRRDLAIFSLHANELYDTILVKLKASTNPLLNLTEVQTFLHHSEYNFILLNIGNVQASRKQVVPIITSIPVDF